MLFCDTCALLAWTLELGPPMSSALRQRLGRERTLASALSACEIAWKVRLGKLELGLTPEAFWRRVESLPIEILATDAATWLAAVALDWPHRDPADRALVAHARQTGATLVTCDRHIQAFYPHCAW